MSVYSQPFYGRHTTLRALSAQLAHVASTGTGRLIAVRGRRQIGKSTVIERFLATANTPYVFVTGVFQATASQQLADAATALRESRAPLPDAGLFAESAPGSWTQWLSGIALAARTGPVIVVLDEFPWLAAAEPSLEGQLQAQWDRTLERLPVLVILIGSDVTMMDRLAQHDRPLFGRVTPLIVPALNPAEIAEALPNQSAVSVFDAAMITGGYPRLVTDLARSSVTPRQYVRDALADDFSPLVTTARLSLDAEFPEPQAAYQVLSAIGANERGNPSFGDLLGALGPSGEPKSQETALTRALRTLTDTKGMIVRETPAWSPPASRLRRYRLTDPYLRFWFRYIERNIERISRGRIDLAVSAFDRDWPSWRGRAVEPFVREALNRLAITDPALQGVEEVRAWWNRDATIEVDVVAISAQRSTLIGTVKWRERGGVTRADLAELREQRARLPRAEDAALAAISAAGPAPVGADYAFTADDLLHAWRQ